MSWKIGDGNRSIRYMLPMLGDKLSQFYIPNDKGPKGNFRNCFIDDLNNTDVSNNLLLLYRFSGTQPYVEFESLLVQNPFYKMMYEPDKFHTMYVFNLPEEFAENYDLFIQGKYSKFSKKYKDKIQSFHSLKDDDLTMDVLYKREPAFLDAEKRYGIRIPRTQEASSIPQIDIECYSDQYKVVDVVKDSNKLYTDFD